MAEEEADARRFPGLHPSWQALAAAPGTTAVLNAANEVAVAAFLDGHLRFDRIAAVIADVLDAVPDAAADSLEVVFAADREAREVAASRVRAYLAVARP